MRASAAYLAFLLAAWPALAEETVSLELLEFLGSFETADGKWIDPTRLETPPAPKADEAEEKENE